MNGNYNLRLVASLRLAKDGFICERSIHHRRMNSSEIVCYHIAKTIQRTAFVICVSIVSKRWITALSRWLKQSRIGIERAIFPCKVHSSVTRFFEIFPGIAQILRRFQNCSKCAWHQGLCVVCVLHDIVTHINGTVGKHFINSAKGILFTSQTSKVPTLLIDARTRLAFEYGTSFVEHDWILSIAVQFIVADFQLVQSPNVRGKLHRNETH
mmetsp:Transcript_24374/g.37580  ORF Transcript_24374/g.37580 Transcript_24374/m.37580 type:complete len:211 (+) Transcript_24374:2398-3030(+)